MTARTSAVLVLVVAAVSAGCGNEDDERDAAATVTRLVEAIDHGDGAAACEELTEKAAATLAKAPGATCETEVVELDVAPSEVAGVSISITSGEVDLVGGGSFFLDETSEGWKVSAAACEPRPGQPHDCELEG